MKRLTLKTATLLTLIALSLFANHASALDDGGGRSVFARGAGERGLALGGAYAAVANDASAMIWNPAGLARIQRKSIYASHTDLIGMGFSEQLGMVTLPSWQLGNFGLGLRRFGVDGIEGRDDRGTIYDDNLEDSETEILFGYGRKIGGAWDVGMLFKYQQHSLAGNSDGAPGFDIGVMVKPLQALGGESVWANSMNLGFAIRNLIEPNIRLVEDAVKDPTGLRFGLAFDGDLSKNLHLVVASDVEKTREMDTRIHVGTEVRLFDLLALRVGSNAGLMSAGAGFNIRNLTVNYAFEDNPLETVHRFGLGVALGKSNDEKYQQSLEAKEAELQKRLEKSFLKENAARTKGLLAQVQQALDDSEYSRALNKVEAVKVLDPSHEGLEMLEGQAYFGQGQELEKLDDLSGAAIAYKRCLTSIPNHYRATENLANVSLRSNQLAARSDAIHLQFEASLEAYALGEFEKARQGFTNILELNPDDKEAAALLKSTIQTLTLRADSLIDQAKAQTVANNFVVARALVQQVREIDPAHRSLASTTEFIDGKERDYSAARKANELAAKKTAVTPSPKVGVTPVMALPSFASLSAQDQKEVVELYQRGIKAVEYDRHDDAVRYWELVWSKAPDYQQVAQNLKQEYLDQGMEAFADGRLEQSIEIWEKARSVAPDDAKTRGYLERAYEHNSKIREIKGDH